MWSLLVFNLLGTTPSRPAIKALKTSLVSKFVINTGAFSCDEVFVITFSFLTRWLRNFAKNSRYHPARENDLSSFSLASGNSTKYSDFIDGKDPSV